MLLWKCMYKKASKSKFAKVMNFDSENFDVTANLVSLRFESALEKDDLKLIPLRYRCSSMLFQGSAHAIYFLKCLHDVRNLKPVITNPNRKKVSVKLFMELNMTDKEPLLVGIIGAGRLGSQLAKLILEYVKLPTQELKISTRRPETIKYLSDKGVTCCFDNKAVASTVHILYICCLPSQLSAVAQSLRGNLSPRTIIYLLTTGFTIKRLRNLFDHENIINPKYEWNDELYETWDLALDVADLYKDSKIMMQTFPLKMEKRFVSLDEKSFTIWIYALINFCSSRSLNISQTLMALNNLILGVSDFDEAEDDNSVTLMSAEDIVHGIDGQEFFPPFDLTEIASRLTFVDKRVETDVDFRNVILENYCKLFVELQKEFKQIF